MDRIGTFSTILGNFTAEWASFPVQLQEMEEDFGGLPGQWFPPFWNRVQGEMDQLPRPQRQKDPVGGLGTPQTLRPARPGGHPVVHHPERSQQVRLFQCRTQNKIKNRFYGTIRNFIRFLLGYFDSARTCYNFEISKLSPKFLNDLYSSQNGTDPLIQPSSSWAGRPKKPSTPWTLESTRRSWPKGSGSTDPSTPGCIRSS